MSSVSSGAKTTASATLWFWGEYLWLVFHGTGVGSTRGAAALRLTSPSGESWEYGNPDSDRSLAAWRMSLPRWSPRPAISPIPSWCVRGTAELWMRNAQCFAGAAAEPPAPGYGAPNPQPEREAVVSLFVTTRPNGLIRQRVNVGGEIARPSTAMRVGDAQRHEMVTALMGYDSSFGGAPARKAPRLSNR